MVKNPYPEVTALVNKLTLPQKITLGITAGAALLLFGIMMIYMNEPEYSVLFTNLQEEDASKVIEHLNTEKVPYSLAEEGRTVKVPKDVVYETRLKLSSKGIPGSGIIGYEIFDKNTLGMSEFLQKLNYKRALEGELSRTIMQHEGVEGVRVHIVTPERSVFREEERAPTASVLLKLANTNALSANNIKSIIHLVSSSVEGLTPENVTLIDSKGKLLSKESQDDPLVAAGTRQYEIKQNVENYLARKAQSLLDNILGFGNSYIKVNAEINFDQVDKTMEIFDPESQVAISEQKVRTENSDKTIADSSEQASENSIINYEINKTVQRVVEGTGNIYKLTVAAVINDVYEEVEVDGETELVRKPRSDEQMEKLEQLIKNSVGFDSERSDQLSLVNISFETNAFEDPTSERLSSPMSFYKDYNKLTNFIFIIIAIGASLFIIRNLMQKLKSEKVSIGNMTDQYLPSAPPKPEIIEKKTEELPQETEMEEKPQIAQPKRKPQLSPGKIEDEITDEAHQEHEKQLKITTYVKDNPFDAAKLINAWLHEDE